MKRKLFSRHTPKGLEKYRDLSEKDIEKMSNKEKFEFLDKEYEKAGRNEFRYAKKKAKKHGIVGGMIGAGISSYASRGTNKGHMLTSGIVGGVGGGLIGAGHGYLRGEKKAREEGHDRIKILEKNAERLDKASKNKENIYDLYAKCKVYDEAIGTDSAEKIKTLNTGKKVKVFSNYLLEKKFNDESEEKKKKDSGFGWGKALGTAAAVAGTMYGAKKGMFGSRIQRGYNTAYGKLGNALGSQSMVNSAARDWAIGSVKNPGSKGSKMQYNRDIINKQNEFKSQFNQPTGNSGSGPTPKSTVSAPVKQETPATVKENVSPFLTGTGFNSTSSKPNFDNLVNKNTVIPTAQPNTESIMKKTNRPFMGPVSKSGSIDDKVYGLQMGNITYNPNTSNSVGSIMQPKPQQVQQVSPAITPQQRRDQRLATTGAENYQLAQQLGYKTEKTVRKPKMSREDYNAMKARKAQEHERRTQVNKDRKNKKNAGLMGVTNPDPNTFYTSPEMFQQRTMSVLEGFGKRKYFSEKEETRKKRVRNAALLGVGALGLGAAAAYGIKNRNKRKNIKELTKTVKRNNQNIKELRDKKEEVLTNLENSKKELGELHKKAKALANGEYKYTQEEINEFMKNMEDPNYVLEL